MSEGSLCKRQACGLPAGGQEPAQGEPRVLALPGGGQDHDGPGEGPLPGEQVQEGPVRSRPRGRGIHVQVWPGIHRTVLREENQ